MIFSFKLFGKPTHVVTHPRHVSIIHGNPDTFEITSVLKAALVALGASSEASELFWSPRMQSGVSSKDFTRSHC
ncbi:hypothetical protein DPSP01_007711 [Paraphaeosphaeria sporulosa]